MRASLIPMVISITALIAHPSFATDDPVSQAQAVINAQISAFLNNDAETAFSFAAPALRGTTDKDRFIAMVQKNYQPVYRPGNYAFGRSKAVGGGELVMQEVMISGREGKDWTAIYQLRLQDDGNYKIEGVQILQKSASTGL